MFNNMFKKAFLLGIGSMSLTKKKVEDMVDEMVRQGEIEAKDRMKAIDAILKEGEKVNEENMHKIRDMLKKDVHDLGLVTREEYEALRKRIETLEFVTMDIANLKDRIEVLEKLIQVKG